MFPSTDFTSTEGSSININENDSSDNINNIININTNSNSNDTNDDSISGTQFTPSKPVGVYKKRILQYQNDMKSIKEENQRLQNCLIMKNSASLSETQSDSLNLNDQLLIQSSVDNDLDLQKKCWKLQKERDQLTQEMINLNQKIADLSTKIQTDSINLSKFAMDLTQSHEREKKLSEKYKIISSKNKELKSLYEEATDKYQQLMVEKSQLVFDKNEKDDLIASLQQTISVLKGELSKVQSSKKNSDESSSSSINNSVIQFKDTEIQRLKSEKEIIEEKLRTEKNNNIQLQAKIS